MVKKGVVIAPHEGFAHIAGTVCREMDFDFDVVSCSTVIIAVELGKKYAADGVTVIVSRGGMAKGISRAVTQPVVAVEITFMDLLDALNQVKHLQKPVALILNADLSFDIDKVPALLGMEVAQFNVPVGGNAIDTIAEVKARGYEVIVGGPAPVFFAEAAGLQAILFESSRESIRSALVRADELIRLDELSLLQDNTVRGILDYAQEGMIITNENGEIALLNKSAEKMLNINRDSVVGRSYAEALPFLPVHDVESLSSGRIGDWCKVNGTPLLQNTIPFLNGTMRGTISTLYTSRLLDAFRPHEQKEFHLKGHVAQYTFDSIITQSAPMRRVIERARSFSQVDSTILITGETGTGKELFAQSIHNASARRNRPFVAINCASIPDSILESELFGYETGAFTGAVKGGKKGFFEMAEGGTLFLDEIGEIAPNLQSKLLRVLQQKEIVRVGGDRVIPVDIRIIVATLVDMAAAVRAGRFRRDLYYRLNILRLSIPPLRERVEDVPLLINVLSEKTAARLGLPVLRLDERLTAKFLDYPWLGNVRELENAVERLTIVQRERAICDEEIDAVLEDMRQEAVWDDAVFFPSTLADMEKKLVNDTLAKFHGDKTKTCHALGISQATLWRRLKEWSIQNEQ